MRWKMKGFDCAAVSIVYRQLSEGWRCIVVVDICKYAVSKWEPMYATLENRLKFGLFRVLLFREFVNLLKEKP